MENSPTCWQESESNLDAALAMYVLKLNLLIIWILPACLFTQHLPVGCSFLKSLCSWMTCCKLLCGLWRCSILVIQAVLPVCYWSRGTVFLPWLNELSASKFFVESSQEVIWKLSAEYAGLKICLLLHMCTGLTWPQKLVENRGLYI